jgi:hypothetical protein
MPSHFVWEQSVTNKMGYAYPVEYIQILEEKSIQSEQINLLT